MENVGHFKKEIFDESPENVFSLVVIGSIQDDNELGADR